MTEATRGAKLVRLGFNPSASTAVQRIKRAGAALIDAIDAEPGDPRAKAVAVTNAQQACMWGVNAVTDTEARR